MIKAAWVYKENTLVHTATSTWAGSQKFWGWAEVFERENIASVTQTDHHEHKSSIAFVILVMFTGGWVTDKSEKLYNG